MPGKQSEQTQSSGENTAQRKLTAQSIATKFLEIGKKEKLLSFLNHYFKYRMALIDGYLVSRTNENKLATLNNFNNFIKPLYQQLCNEFKDLERLVPDSESRNLEFTKIMNEEMQQNGDLQKYAYAADKALRNFSLFQQCHRRIMDSTLSTIEQINEFMDQPLNGSLDISADNRSEPEESHQSFALANFNPDEINQIKGLINGQSTTTEPFAKIRAIDPNQPLYKTMRFSLEEARLLKKFLDHQNKKNLSAKLQANFDEYLKRAHQHTNLAMQVEHEGDWEQALALYKKALIGYRKVFNIKNDNVKQCMPENGEPIRLSSSQATDPNRTPTHHSVSLILALENIADCIAKHSPKDRPKAVEYYNEAIDLMRSIFITASLEKKRRAERSQQQGVQSGGAAAATQSSPFIFNVPNMCDSIDLARLIWRQAHLLLSLNRETEAVAQFRSALEMMRREYQRLGRRHDDELAQLFSDTGSALELVGQKKDAVNSHKEALDIRRKTVINASVISLALDVCNYGSSFKSAGFNKKQADMFRSISDQDITRFWLWTGREKGQEIMPFIMPLLSNNETGLQESLCFAPTDRYRNFALADFNSDEINQIKELVRSQNGVIDASLAQNKVIDASLKSLFAKINSTHQNMEFGSQEVKLLKQFLVKQNKEDFSEKLHAYSFSDPRLIEIARSESDLLLNAVEDKAAARNRNAEQFHRSSRCERQHSDKIVEHLRLQDWLETVEGAVPNTWARIKTIDALTPYHDVKTVLAAALPPSKTHVTVGGVTYDASMPVTLDSSNRKGFALSEFAPQDIETLRSIITTDIASLSNELKEIFQQDQWNSNYKSIEFTTQQVNELEAFLIKKTQKNLRAKLLLNPDPAFTNLALFILHTGISVCAAGFSNNGIEYIETALSILRRETHNQGYLLAYALTNGAISCMKGRNYSHALDLLLEAQRAIDRMPPNMNQHDMNKCYAHINIAMIQQNCGDIEKALVSITAADRICDNLINANFNPCVTDDVKGHVHTQRAFAHWRSKDYDTAISEFRRAYEIRQKQFRLDASTQPQQQNNTGNDDDPTPAVRPPHPHVMNAMSNLAVALLNKENNTASWPEALRLLECAHDMAKNIKEINGGAVLDAIKNNLAFARTKLGVNNSGNDQNTQANQPESQIMGDLVWLPLNSLHQMLIPNHEGKPQWLEPTSIDTSTNPNAGAAASANPSNRKNKTEPLFPLGSEDVVVHRRLDPPYEIFARYSVRRQYKAKAKRMIDHTHAASRHPNILIALLAVKHHNGTIDVDVEYCDGGTLGAFIPWFHPEHRPFAAMSIVKQVLMSLQYNMLVVSDKVHHNLCPRYIYLKRDGCVKTDIPDLWDLESLHHSWAYFSRLPYTAPELRRSPRDYSKSDEKADVWAIGVLIFAIMIGRTLQPRQKALRFGEPAPGLTPGLTATEHQALLNEEQAAYEADLAHFDGFIFVPEEQRNTVWAKWIPDPFLRFMAIRCLDPNPSKRISIGEAHALCILSGGVTQEAHEWIAKGAPPLEQPADVHAAVAHTAKVFAAQFTSVAQPGSAQAVPAGAAAASTSNDHAQNPPITPESLISSVTKVPLLEAGANIVARPMVPMAPNGDMCPHPLSLDILAFEDLGEAGLVPGPRLAERLARKPLAPLPGDSLDTMLTARDSDSLKELVKALKKEHLAWKASRDKQLLKSLIDKLMREVMRRRAIPAWTNLKFAVAYARETRLSDNEKQLRQAAAITLTSNNPPPAPLVAPGSAAAATGMFSPQQQHSTGAPNGNNSAEANNGNQQNKGP